MQLEALLQRFFGYSQFRSGQKEIIEAIVRGSYVLALLPTGGGKSLCYQVPGLALGGTTIVVSPLISLMKDQVDALERRGIPATYLNSSLAPYELKNRVKRLRENEYRFVYVAPERLVSPDFVKICENTPIKLVAVDEAHCISQWGHDFRPEYMKIAQFVAQLPKRPIVCAFTATATPQVQIDICQSLQLHQPVRFSRSFARTNLQVAVRHCQTRNQQQLELFYLLQQWKGQAGIVYTLTRAAAEQTAQWITRSFRENSRENSPMRVGVYHGGLTSEQRTEVQEAFLAHKLDIIVATNAFGMGVDKSDIRFVIHLQTPLTVENYYQEIGRGGRDGQTSWCVLLHHQSNTEVAQEFIKKSPRAAQAHQQWQALQKVLQGRKCRQQAVLRYFGEMTAPACGQCDNCGWWPFVVTEEDREYYRNLLVKSASNHYLTRTQAAWLTLIKPKTAAEWALIPGVGRGLSSRLTECIKKT